MSESIRRNYSVCIFPALTSSAAMACVLICTSALAQAPPGRSDDALETVVVTATLRTQTLQSAPASVTVLNEQTLQEAGVQHAQDVLGLIPNLNWASGTSRPRYFQLRGIGERDQYQGAPTSSVGFLIDDIDFSGVAMPAMLFDVDQLEVLRGPQGTSDGANALAGLIKLKTRDPQPQYEFRGEAMGGDYDTQSAAAVIGGPLGEDNAFRVVAQHYRSDGFRDNVFLGRDDTNGFDEINTRAKLHFSLGERWRVDLLGIYADQDDGYDAWSLDNSLTTRSDYPGRDTQRTKAAEARVQYAAPNGMTFESITTYSALDIGYSFDDDWASNDYWQHATDYGPYNYYSDIRRHRSTRSEDLRLSSPANAQGLGWVVGLYAINLREGNSDLEYAQDVAYDSIGSSSTLVSDYDATNTAAYGQLEYALSPDTQLIGGLRFEHRDARYSDSDGADFNPGENMAGGNLSLMHNLTKDHSVRATLSRGYKAGGFNIGEEVPEAKRSYDAEYLWNLEAGDRHSWADGRIATDVTLFYMRRDQQQVSSSTQDPANPASFVFVTDNAARGENYGLESSASWKVTERWRLQGTFALLRARYVDYHYVDPNTGEAVDLSGREQAHAPDYQYSLSAEWRHPLGFSVRADLTGLGPFYFDATEDVRSHAYDLVNLRAAYDSEHWSASLWSRNVFNTYYSQRGFYFGLEPPDFPNQLYRDHGDPRTWGVTVEWRVK